MNLPTSISGIIILIVVLLPGVPAEAIYTSQVGVDWREDTWLRIVRMVVISIFGLVLEIVVAVTITEVSGYDIGTPRHIYPANFSAEYGEVPVLPMATGFFYHAVFACLLGLGAGWGLVKIREAMGLAKRPAVWDELTNDWAEEHWVIVETENGSIFAGRIKGADTEVPKEDRDLVISVPAVYNEEQGEFELQHQKYLYIPAAHIRSVSVVYNTVGELERDLEELDFDNHILFGRGESDE